jgi:hypothetical protein
MKQRYQGKHPHSNRERICSAIIFTSLVFKDGYRGKHKTRLLISSEIGQLLLTRGKKGSVFNEG